MGWQGVRVCRGALQTKTGDCDKNEESLSFRARGEREQAQQIRRQPECGRIKIPSEI